MVGVDVSLASFGRSNGAKIEARSSSIEVSYVAFDVDQLWSSIDEYTEIT